MRWGAPQIRSLRVPAAGPGLAAAGLLAVAVLLWRGPGAQRVRAPAPAMPAPPSAAMGALPTGLGPLVPPAPGSVLVGGFGWTERAGRPVFQSFARLRVRAGAELRAVAAGTVAAVRDDPAGPGLHVLVAHDLGWASLYGGCGSVLVRVRQQVRAGDAVCAAPAGPAPADAAFGLLQAGHPVDPAPYVSLG